MDKNFEKNFEICVRAVIRRGGKVLVCRRKGKEYYFFPGGHVDFGEPAKKALERELREELDLTIKNTSFMGTVENVFHQDGEVHHEVNLVFQVDAENAADKSQEDHLDFFFLDMEEFSEKNVLPLVLRDNVVRWLDNEETFWASHP
jgi:8-oxo-dGTP diphosphatase